MTQWQMQSHVRQRAPAWPNRTRVRSAVGIARRAPKLVPCLTKLCDRHVRGNYSWLPLHTRHGMTCVTGDGRDGRLRCRPSP